MPDTALIPRTWDVTDGVVPLAQVRRSAGLSTDTVVRAMKKGHFESAGSGAPRLGGGYCVDVETALLILAAGVLCAALGLTFAAALRALRQGAGDVTAKGILFPIIPFDKLT